MEPRTNAARSRKRQIAVRARNGGNNMQHAILEAAATFFAEQGYAAASTAELAARCGVSKALLFHYYAGKEAILFDLLDGYTRHLLEIVAETHARHAPGASRLHALIRAFLETYQSSRARHIVLLNDVKYLPKRQREIILDHEREIVAAFATALREAYSGDVGAAHAAPLAMMLFGMINWTFTWLQPQGLFSYADFAEAVIAMLQRGAKGAAAAIDAKLHAPRTKPKPRRTSRLAARNARDRTRL